jgi:serine/threonine protein kinase
VLNKDTTTIVQSAGYKSGSQVLATENSTSVAEQMFCGGEPEPQMCNMNKNGVQMMTMPLDEALFIILQIAEGVKYLHQHQVVPRDLEASNILVKAADEKSP